LSKKKEQAKPNLDVCLFQRHGTFQHVPIAAGPAHALQAIKEPVKLCVGNSSHQRQFHFVLQQKTSKNKKNNQRSKGAHNANTNTVHASLQREKKKKKNSKAQTLSDMNRADTQQQQNPLLITQYK
jgi:hypothetical protein